MSESTLNNNRRKALTFTPLILLIAFCLITIRKSPKRNNRTGSEKAIFLMQNARNSTLDSLMGYSATARGIDADNKPFIIRIHYTNTSRNSVWIPSFQERRTKSHESEHKFRRDSLTDYNQIRVFTGLDTSDAKKNVELYSTFIKDFFHKYEIRNMASLLDLGDFITFDFGGGYSMRYKSPHGSIRGNQVLRKEFDNRLSLGHGWYILRRKNNADFIAEMASYIPEN